METDLFSPARVQATPHVMMVTHVLPYPPAAGNEIRIYKMLSWFRQRGYGITLVLKPLGDTEVPNECIVGLRGIVDQLYVFDNRFIAGATARKVDPEFDDPALAQIQDGFCPAWFVDEVAAIAADLQPDVVIAQYVFMSRILQVPECADALKIIDAHDLFCRKQATVEQYGIKNYGLSLTDDQERKLLQRADAVLAIQRIEQEEIARLVPSRKVLLTSFDLVPQHAGKASIVPGRVLIVASGNEFNVRGTQDFLDYTWPLVRQICPDARLRIVGKVCREVSCDDPTVALLGFVESLDAEYAEAEVVVNPCRVGTGLKIKTIEALAWGKAHVAWPSAADGLRELGDVPAVIATDVVTFADAIAGILQSQERRLALQTAAHAFIYEHFRAERVYGDLCGAIEAHRPVGIREEQHG
ncbi:glycosyltransferase family 4 protein [Burkholderia multivorans]|uniref:glycosyltransferase family 4 protein n=1 Tax=Burkholderia multivorans TaxID=87883 RepID=UPI001C6121B6|nr:glycosyltransferase family 4 protein [Burkholderia multivorans]MDN7961055.1 glycosyltransferase family 4 protein [Burkholderia multivorans]